MRTIPATVRAMFGISLGATMMLAVVSVADVGAARPTSSGPADGAIAPPAEQAGFDELGGVASTHVLVRVRPGVAPALDGDGKPSLRGADGRLADALRPIATAFNIAGIAPALRRAPMNAPRAAALGLDRFLRIDVPAGTDTRALARELTGALGGAEGFIELAECDGVGGLAETIPDDASFSAQYALRNTGQVVAGQPGIVDADIDATNAWDVSTGSPGITIAFLDSGMDAHPEIAGRILAGTNIPVPGGPTTDGCSSHGTHVAGIAAATGNNGVGIAGVCWNAMLLPIVVVNPCTGLESYVADGLVYAADSGADIANMSLQYSVGSEYLHTAVLYAFDAGMLLVAATGNSGGAVAYPAKWPECIAVAATDNKDARWPSSNFGPEVDVSAPGWQVYSLSGANGFAYKTGTSMSVPHVVGIAALLWSIKPSLDAAEVRAFIESTCDDIAPAGIDTLTGHGRVNAAAAVAALIATFSPADLNQDGVVDGGDLGLLLGSWGPCADCELLPCPADLDDSCGVDGADLGIMLGSWG